MTRPVRKGWNAAGRCLTVQGCWDCELVYEQECPTTHIMEGFCGHPEGPETALANWQYVRPPPDVCPLLKGAILIRLAKGGG